MAHRWVNEVDEQSRALVKSAALSALGSPVTYARRGAAVVISNIASIELPRGYWGDLIMNLVHLVTKQVTSEQDLFQKEASLETIGYICEEIVRRSRANHCCRCSDRPAHAYSGARSARVGSDGAGQLLGADSDGGDHGHVAEREQQPRQVRRYRGHVQLLVVRQRPLPGRGTFDGRRGVPPPRCGGKK